jgi:quercetin dioxygenase-like cupin family protein
MNPATRFARALCSAHPSIAFSSLISGRYISTIGLILTAVVGSACESSPAPATPHPPTTASHNSEQAPAPPAASSATPPPSKPQPPSSVSGDLPSLTSGITLENSSECSAKHCMLPHLVPNTLLGKLTAPEGNDSSNLTAFVWDQHLKAKSRLELPRQSNADVFAVVIHGKVKVSAVESRKDSKILKVWQAAYLPGAGGTLQALEADARVIMIAVTEKVGIWAITQQLMCLGNGPKPKSYIAPNCINILKIIRGMPDSPWAEEPYWKKRPGAIAVTDFQAQADLSWAGGAYHARIGFEAPTTKRAGLGILKMSKDAGVPEHKHANEWEHLVVLGGQGHVQLNGEHGDKLPIQSGSIVSVPPGILHQWLPGNQNEFLALQLYTPPGPEQRFRKLAKPQPPTP